MPDDWEAFEAVCEPPVDAPEDGFSPECVVWPWEGAEISDEPPLLSGWEPEG